MLDENINDSFKVSNNPILTGWNPTISIRLILAQLEVSYGKPKGKTVWDNNKLFKLPFLATKAPQNCSFIVLNSVRKLRSLCRTYTCRNNSSQMPSIISSNQAFFPRI
jgi:hypothetical protein